MIIVTFCDIIMPERTSNVFIKLKKYNYENHHKHPKDFSLVLGTYIVLCGRTTLCGGHDFIRDSL